MKHGSPLIVAALCLGALAQAEDVRLEWQPNQIASKINYYMPVRLELSATKPEAIKKVPEGVTAPLYGVLKLGPKDAPASIGVVLDEPEGAPARLWFDRNGNGDLSDDPPAVWTENKSANSAKWRGTATVDVTYGTEKREMGLTVYRFDSKDPRHAAMKNAIFYYRNFGYAGNVAIGGKSYPALLIDDESTGDFRGSQAPAMRSVNLLLDLNGDGRFDTQAERFDVRQPFNVAGTTYEVSGLDAIGGKFTITSSTRTVAERPKAPQVGKAPYPFEQKNIAGQAVHFPEAFKGKLVLLDFWATWCGPCMREVPGVVQVYKEFHDRGFEILGISLDGDEGPEKLPKFTQDRGMTWDQICQSRDGTSPIAMAYGVGPIPSSFLVDGKSGHIVAMGEDLRGPNLRATVEQCLAKLGEPGVPKLAARTEKTPGPIVNPATSSDPLVAKAAAMMSAGKLLSAEDFMAKKQSPQAGPVNVLPAGTTPLPGREIARRATAGYLRAGWFFHCTKCGNWHVNLAGGYSIATDTVVTAHHVMQPPDNMKPGDGYPILVRGDNEIIPVSGVVADDAAMDAIVLRAGASDLKPLPLGTDVQVGDSVWCLSDPRGERNYFSTGIVNRFVSHGSNDLRLQRIDVSTDWAPGSSGAAVLDSAGNVIGHVATIRALFSKTPYHAPDAKPGEASATGTPGTAMNIHEAVPAKSVLTLIPH